VGINEIFDMGCKILDMRSRIPDVEYEIVNCNYRLSDVGAWRAKPEIQGRVQEIIMAFDVRKLVRKMFKAFETSLAEKWPEVKDYAEAEAKKMAESLVMIEKLVITGQINEDQAKLHYQIQRNSTRIVLLTIEGLGIIAVEQAINAALDVLKDTVNTALDFTLI